MKTKYFFWLICFSEFFSLQAQQLCGSGFIGVSGNGCGCLVGCDLTLYGGPNCGTGVLGNCNTGYHYMSISVAVPANCSVSAFAEMKKHLNCHASGADDGNWPVCSQGDRLRIVSTANPVKAYQCGTNNDSISDTEFLTGPGSITIEGRANRADEIISYSVNYVNGSACGTSCDVLPVVWNSFFMEHNDKGVILHWQTLSESNNGYFDVQYFWNDQFVFKNRVFAKGTVGVASDYNSFVLCEKSGMNYFRIKQTDLNGNFSFSPVLAVEKPEEPDLAIFPNPALQGTPVKFNFGRREVQQKLFLEVIDGSGRKIFFREIFPEDENFIYTPSSPGLFLIRLESEKKNVFKRMIVY